MRESPPGVSVAFAGLSYRWQALMLSAEVEKRDLVDYAFRVGTRVAEVRSHYACVADFGRATDDSPWKMNRPPRAPMIHT